MISSDRAYSKLTEVFRYVFFDDSLTLSAEMSAKDIEGWDSINHINLILAIEERFGIKITEDEIENLKTVGDLANLVTIKAT